MMILAERPLFTMFDSVDRELDHVNTKICNEIKELLDPSRTVESIRFPNNRVTCMKWFVMFHDSKATHVEFLLDPDMTTQELRDCFKRMEITRESRGTISWLDSNDQFRRIARSSKRLMKPMRSPSVLPVRWNVMLAPSNSRSRWILDWQKHANQGTLWFICSGGAHVWWTSQSIHFNMACKCQAKGCVGMLKWPTPRGSKKRNGAGPAFTRVPWFLKSEFRGLNRIRGCGRGQSTCEFMEPRLPFIRFGQQELIGLLNIKILDSWFFLLVIAIFVRQPDIWPLNSPTCLMEYSLPAIQIRKTCMCVMRIWKMNIWFPVDRSWSDWHEFPEFQWAVLVVRWNKVMTGFTPPKSFLIESCFATLPTGYFHNQDFFSWSFVSARFLSVALKLAKNSKMKSYLMFIRVRLQTPKKRCFKSTTWTKGI